MGGIGHAMVSAARKPFFDSIACQAPTRAEVKGKTLTENYSVLRPEVMEDSSGTPITSANRGLRQHLLRSTR